LNPNGIFLGVLKFHKISYIRKTIIKYYEKNNYI